MSEEAGYLFWLCRQLEAQLDVVNRRGWFRPADTELVWFLELRRREIAAGIIAGRYSG